MNIQVNNFPNLIMPMSDQQKIEVVAQAIQSLLAIHSIVEIANQIIVPTEVLRKLIDSKSVDSIWIDHIAEALNIRHWVVNGDVK